MRESILLLSLAAMAAAPSFGTTPPAAAQAAEAICPVTDKTIPAGRGVIVRIKTREYRVFDVEAARLLKENPGRYLETDGTPRNQPVKQAPSNP